MRTLTVRTIGDAARDSGRDNNFLVIRLIAAIAVVYGHSYAISPMAGHQDLVARITGAFWSGGVGLYTFFVISGFLVAGSYLNRGRLIDFLQARILRIIPGLFVCMVGMTLVLGPLMTTVPLSQYFHDRTVLHYFTYNILLIKTQHFLPGVFTNLTVPGVNGPIWSLFLEGRLYLVLGFLGFCGILARRRLMNAAGVMLILLGYSAPSYLTWLAANANDLNCCLLFLVGTLMYLNREYIPLNQSYLYLFLFLAFLFHGTPQFTVTFVAALIYGIMWLSYVPKLPWIGNLGDYSYGVYIYGWPVQQIVRTYFPGASPLQNFALTMPVVLILAALSWHLVEKRALAMKQNKWLDRLKMVFARPSSSMVPAAAVPAPHLSRQRIDEETVITQV